MERNFSAFSITLDYREDHGILGQKWGVRRYQNVDGTLTKAGKKRYSNVSSMANKKTGETVYLNQKHQSKSKKFASNLDYDIVVGDQKVGNLFLEDHKDSLYVNWININDRHQGKGYAQTVVDAVVNKARNDGYEKVTLEVPEGDDVARHVYEKNGFVATKTDEYGLTRMERKVNDAVKIEATDVSSKKVDSYIKKYVEKAAGPLMVAAAIYTISKYMESKQSDTPINFADGPQIVDKNGNPVSEEKLRELGLI